MNYKGPLVVCNAHLVIGQFGPIFTGGQLTVKQNGNPILTYFPNAPLTIDLPFTVADTGGGNNTITVDMFIEGFTGDSDGGQPSFGASIVATFTPAS